MSGPARSDIRFWFRGETISITGISPQKAAVGGPAAARRLTAPATPETLLRALGSLATEERP